MRPGHCLSCGAHLTACRCRTTTTTGTWCQCSAKLLPVGASAIWMDGWLHVPEADGICEAER